MSLSPNFETVLESLEQRGRPKPNEHWSERRPDYVAEYSLSAEHIPALIDMATTWSDADSDDPAVYAQIHAWRALAQLGAVDAIQPLLELQEELDIRDDDWYLDDFHLVFGLIGPPAVEPLAEYLRDTTRSRFPREKTAGGLAEIAARFPGHRERVVNLLIEELSRHDRNQAELNGSLVSDLIDLNAGDAAEAIERAFAANVIDPIIVGDWGDVRNQLGIEGLGLAPDRTPGWTTIAERLGFSQTTKRSNPVDAEIAAAIDRRQRIQAQRKLKELKERARAKRKEQKKSRKRNRKAR